MFTACSLLRRYWDLVQTHKVTQFYTAPTASKCRSLSFTFSNPVAAALPFLLSSSYYADAIRQIFLI